MNWDDLRYLLAIERRRTLAAAARELGVTKATASRRLAALEEASGTRLVDRTPGGLVLTAAGRVMAEAAAQVESTVASLEGRLQATDAEPRGVVRLTAPQWLADRLLVPELPSLRGRYPHLEVDLIGTNRMLNLVQREADVAIRNVKPTHRSLKTRRIGDFGGCIYGSREYLARRGIPASRDDMRSHDVLVYEGIGGIPGFEWMRDAEQGGRISFRANDAMGLLAATRAGVGLAALPCMLGDVEPALERVTTLGVSRCGVFLVGHEEVFRTPRVRAVVDFVVDVFQRNRDVVAG